MNPDISGEALSALIAERIGAPTAVGIVRATLSQFLSHMGDVLQAGGTVNLGNLGSLVPVRCAPRKGRNPRTKLEVTIPAKTRIRFRVNRKFAAALNP